MFRSSIRNLLLNTSVVSSAMLFASTSGANPLDGVVVGGSADITSPDANTLLIQQRSDNAIINWRSFDIGVGETTEFVLPNTSGVTLNRVTGDRNPSQIHGRLKSNGAVMVINPDGILFGESSVVDVGGIIASTADIDDDAFLAGSRNFDKPGNVSASIVNEGNISVGNAGVAAFVAPSVRNDGVIAAKLGRIALGAANTFTLDMYGDDLIKLHVDDALLGDALDVKTGKPMADKVRNSGKLKADGGVVALKAATARKVVNAVINNEGVIEANSVGFKNGKIILFAATKDTKLPVAPLQKVKLSGKLEAIGKKAGEKGGKVYIQGEVVQAKAAKIDASGHSGGGTVLVGGDYLGGKVSDAEIKALGIAWEDYVMSTGTFISLDEMTSLNVDAVEEGKGGKAVVWSDETTLTAAKISAKGGAKGGNGGFIETSGKNLQVMTAADASAPMGLAGTWLLDPLDIRIKDAQDNNYVVFNEEIYPGIFGLSAYPSSVASVIDVNSLEAALNSGSNVRVMTRNTGGSGNGDIYIESDIRKTAGGDVVANLNAAGNIIFSPGVDIVSTSGAMSLHLDATDGEVLGSNVGRINLNGGHLLFDATDGINFQSSFDMPDSFILNINREGPSPRSRVDVNVRFGGDKIAFSHNNVTATIPTDGIRLLDSTAAGHVEIIFNKLNLGFSDRSFISGPNRSWQFNVDPDKAFGSIASQTLNGIPEIVAQETVNINPTGSGRTGIAPVLEVDAANLDNCKLLTCFASGPEGNAWIDTYLRPPPLESRLPIEFSTLVAGSTPMRTAADYDRLIYSTSAFIDKRVKAIMARGEELKALAKFYKAVAGQKGRLIIPKIAPKYGKYGGSKWTGGRYFGVPPSSLEEAYSSPKTAPIDIIDEKFFEHDLAYYRANGNPEAIRDADLKLIADLLSLFERSNEQEQLYMLNAVLFFLARLKLYDVIRIIERNEV